MPSLQIPESGLSLGTAHPPSTPGSPLPEAFALSLTDDVLEQMIACFQNGKPIQLSLGESPSLQYGNKIQSLSTSHDPFHTELYRNTSDLNDSHSSDMAGLTPNHKEGIIRVEDKPNPAFFAMLGATKFIAGKKTTTATASKATAATSRPTPSIAGADAALANLKNSLALESQKKADNSLNYVKESIPIPGKKGAKVTNKSRFLSQNASNPVSPALSSARSPSLGPTAISLSAQQAQHDKAVQKPVIHLLAVEPMSEEDLLDSISDFPANELKQALQKVALSEGSKWALKTKLYKELDVWNFEYEDTDDRQRAIDNAVRVYDKSRLNLNEPEWDRLLPKHERGTGKCLSKLQARLATAESGSVRTPKISVQKAEDSGRDTPKGGEGEVNGGGGSAASLPPANKTKKLSENGAQAKRLLGGKPAKAAVKKATTARAEKPKDVVKPKPRAPAKPKDKIEKPAGKFLSAEKVHDSDDDDDRQPAPAPVKKPAPKAVKRSREDDVDTSDSSIPLSKKVKKDAPIYQNQKTSDASQSTYRTTSTTSSQYKYKGTSPHKSSPLASSPPTNASEVDSSSSVSLSPRKARSPIHKFHQKSSSVASSVSSSSSTRSLKPEVVDLARKYRLYYPKYEALHRQVAGLGRRDREMEERLMDMHKRLATMKSEILEGIVEN